jgi:hypothetical protein
MMGTLRACVLGLALACGIAQAEDKPLICTADRPVAGRGEAVELQAWTDAGEVAWKVSGGTLEGTGKKLIWRLPDRTGRLTASAAASSTAGVAPCSIVVFVTSDSRGTGGRETGSMFLVQGRPEPAGYGLYSYFLLGATPDDNSRERVTRAIDAFLKMTPSLASLDALFDRGELNANHMPVDSLAPEKATAEWILEHYDYARARAVLSRIDGSMRRGPYLLSVLKPAGTRGDILGPMLLQDLSTVPPHLVGDWYRMFLNQVSQEHFWETGRLQAVGMRMRSIVGVLALGLPDVQGAVKQWVKWGQ